MADDGDEIDLKCLVDLDEFFFGKVGGFEQRIVDEDFISESEKV